MILRREVNLMKKYVKPNAEKVLFTVEKILTPSVWDDGEVVMPSFPSLSPEDEAIYLQYAAAATAEGNTAHSVAHIFSW